jgi:hypothetical protein
MTHQQAVMAEKGVEVFLKPFVNFFNISTVHY